MYVIEGRLLLTDSGAINIKYLARINDPNQFDALFIEAYEARMAAEFAFALSGNRSLTETAWVLYRDKISEARSIDSQEGTPEEMQFDSLVNVRR